ncbi:uncharacterized protein [Apostichopus japonicus]|uniref:uncharacterized protein n=1 Tax=Stichopus japonicus TaxID=307972 RepID=UPI003AB2A110
MEYTVGNKIQAIDELGRWEDAVVIGVIQESDSIRVRYIGWSEDHDEELPLSSVRWPVEPFSYGVASSSYGKRRYPQEFRYLSHLRRLSAGEVVSVTYKEKVVTADVLIVDRFKREVTIQLPGGEKVTIHGSQLLSCTEDNQVQKRQRKYPVHTKCKMPRRESMTNRHEISTAAHPSNDARTGAERSDKTGSSFIFAAMDASQCLLSCGDIAHLKDVDLSLAVEQISVEPDGKKTFQGSFIKNGEVMDGVKVSANAEAVHRSKAILSKKTKKFVNDIREKAVKDALLSTKESYFARCQQRKEILCYHGIKKIKQALERRTASKRFSWGVCDLDVDLELFDMVKKRRKEFSMLQGTLGKLDGIFGKFQWDVHFEEGRAQFVSSILIYVKDFQLWATVKIGICHCTIGQVTYREELKKYLCGLQ